MIPDVHTCPDGWGVRPVLFTLAGHDVMSYSFFVGLGLIAAVALYYFNVRHRRVGGNGLAIALAAAGGGILGSKIPAWVANAGAIVADPTNATAWLSGRTIVGGIIGGVLAVWATKRALGIKQRLGNYLVPSLGLGIFFGRIGCFLAGCCYGAATTVPWAVDFGDGVLRNPTQLYEAAFALMLFAYAQWTLDRHEPGRLFRAFMIAYFSWRFGIEFLRANPTWMFGMTSYQATSLAVVFAYILRLTVGSMKGSARWTT